MEGNGHVKFEDLTVWHERTIVIPGGGRAGVAQATSPMVCCGFPEPIQDHAGIGTSLDQATAAYFHIHSSSSFICHPPV
jgi:hypothetical protein